MQPDVLSHQREAESAAGLVAALPGVLTPGETLEDLGPQFDRHSWTVIVDLQTRQSVPFGDCHPSDAPAVPFRVVQEVRHDPYQSTTIGKNQRRWSLDDRRADISAGLD